MAKIDEVIKGNYVIDMTGVGKKLFNFTPSYLERKIRTDLLSLYKGTISYLQVGVYEETLQCKRDGEITQLTVNLYIKCWKISQQDLNNISSYLDNDLISKIN